MPEYPYARRLDLTEAIWSHTVRDPYRWLEDADSAETRAWIHAQDELYTGHAAALPGRRALRNRIWELCGAGDIGTPVWRGELQFFTRRTADQDHAVLLCAREPDGHRCANLAASDGSHDGSAFNDGAARVLIDPMARDPSGGTALIAWHPDREGRLLAYQLSTGGGEQSVLRVMEVATGRDVDEPMTGSRRSPIAWQPGGSAFYYVREPWQEPAPQGDSQFERGVFYHRLGTPAEKDSLVFGESPGKTFIYRVSVSTDGRWLLISAMLGNGLSNDLWLADLTASDPKAPELKAVQVGVNARTTARVGRDGRLYLLTHLGAPRGRLAVTDTAVPYITTWRDLIPQDPQAVLCDFAILDGANLRRPVLLVAWARHAISELTVHEVGSGERLGSVPLPGLGGIGPLTERPAGGHEAWFSYTDYRTPTCVLRFDARAARVEPWADAPASVAIPEVEARQVTYASRDGTKVRMVVISAAGGGPRPTILSGYGGFGRSLTPEFTAAILAWAEAGGAYAVAGLRGGNEEGDEWHRDGMLGFKQNVFDDFHAAAEKLVADGWTTPAQLAITGASNGGLIVGAAITQRPGLFAAAACSAPLLDMVRYERFGLGQQWSAEYGTAADPGQLSRLLSYSPYHHVRAGTAYPAVLFTVFGNDSRVDPMHARKMCAALQDATVTVGRPVLLRREEGVGHGLRALSRSIALSADTLAFLAFHTGLRLPQGTEP